MCLVLVGRNMLPILAPATHRSRWGCGTAENNTRLTSSMVEQAVGTPSLSCSNTMMARFCLGF